MAVTLAQNAVVDQTAAAGTGAVGAAGATGAAGAAAPATPYLPPECQDPTQLLLQSAGGVQTPFQQINFGPKVYGAGIQNPAAFPNNFLVCRALQIANRFPSVLVVSSPLTIILSISTSIFHKILISFHHSFTMILFLLHSLCSSPHYSSSFSSLQQRVNLRDVEFTDQFGQEVELTDAFGRDIEF